MSEPKIGHFLDTDTSEYLLIRIHPDRHVATADTLVFGCINIRSIANKIDDLLQVRVDNSVDVMLLTETWHDKISACFGRLRSE